MRRSWRRSSPPFGGAAALILFLFLFGMRWLQQHPLVVGLAALLLLGGIAAFIFVTWRQREQVRKSGIAEIDHMDGRTFEMRLGLLFRDLGYSVRQTKVSGDFGADLVLHKNGTVTVVQAKRYSLDRKVGVGAVQEVVSAMGMYHAQHAIVITNTYFTAPAKTLAQSNNVELWDRTDLIQALTLKQDDRSDRSKRS